jgi:hypothetical protein
VGAEPQQAEDGALGPGQPHALQQSAQRGGAGSGARGWGWGGGQHWREAGRRCAHMRQAGRRLGGPLAAGSWRRGYRLQTAA